jgi:hypothetical protein
MYYYQNVCNLLFEWDPAKNLTNQRKHGVSFEEAAQVFRPPSFWPGKNGFRMEKNAGKPAAKSRVYPC